MGQTTTVAELLGQMAEINADVVRLVLEAMAKQRLPSYGAW